MSNLDDISLEIGKLIGRMDGVSTDLSDIKKQNGEILSHIAKINGTCAVRGEVLNGHGERLDKIEERDPEGLSRRTKYEMRGTTILTIINSVVTIIKTWMGLP